MLYNSQPPYDFTYINAAESSAYQPSTVHLANSEIARFYQRYFLKRAMSVLDFKIPNNWNKNYFQYILFVNGYISVFKTDKYGIIPQHCGLKGFNIMYQPTNCVISSPLLKGLKEPKIGTQCALIRLQPDYTGIMDVVNTYANKMALCAATLDINILNSKLAYVFMCKNKNASQSFKKMTDKILSGEPAVFTDKELFTEDGSPQWGTFTNNLKANYIAGDLIGDMRSILNDFDSFVGIPNNNVEKRERKNVAEVEVSSVETRTLVDIMLDSLAEGIETANRLFGDIISVNWRYERDTIQNNNTGATKPRPNTI